HVFRAEKYSVDELKKVNGGRLAARIIVCAGAKQAVDAAVSSVDRRGRILFVAGPEGDISIPSMRFWRDEISVVFSYGAAPGDLQQALDLISSGRVNVSKMITHVLPFSDIGKGFKLVSE